MSFSCENVKEIKFHERNDSRQSERGDRDLKLEKRLKEKKKKKKTPNRPVVRLQA